MTRWLLERKNKRSNPYLVKVLTSTLRFVSVSLCLGQEAIQEMGTKLIYLSPYSPEFSSIENFWSKVKEILKKFQARTYEDLVMGITEAMRQVTQQDIRNWFAHCYYCMRMSSGTAIHQGVFF